MLKKRRENKNDTVYEKDDKKGICINEYKKNVLKREIIKYKCLAKK